MPPKIKYTKELVLETSILIIERDGYEALNIRSIAKELGCSTQPIMSCYSSIDTLKGTVFIKVDEIFSEYCMKDIANHTNAFLSIGLNYLKFAKTKSNLFKFLYFTSDFDKQGVNEFFTEEAYHFFKENLKLTQDEAKNFYDCVWIFVHGIAMLSTSDAYLLSDQQTEDYLIFSFNAIYEKTINDRT